MNSQSLSCHAHCISLLLCLQDNSSLSSRYTCAFEFREISAQPKLLSKKKKNTFNVWFATRAALRVSVLNRCIFSLHPYCLCLCPSLSQKEKSSELDGSPKTLIQPKNITKLNEHVDTFVCTRDGGDSGGTPPLECMSWMSTMTYVEVPGYQRF